MLKGKKIVLGVSGSISAYKAAFLVRLLVKEEAEVKVVMTAAAKDFISPLTLSTLSKNPVLSDFTKGNQGEWNNHVDLGIWADLMLVAPSSANTIAKCAHGICDNLLVATYLSAKCPVVFAPAMDLDMYKHGSTLKNLEVLKSNGNLIIEAESGELASGLVGQGRLAEPENIVEFVETLFGIDEALKDKRVLITAGPTQEAIDPVRFISNHSSGKMGYAIAKAFRNAGARVNLVSGPVNIKAPINVDVTPVKSAKEMFEATKSLFGGADIIIYVAAVADYAAKNISDIKIKKKEDDLSIPLERTPDIAGTLGKLKKNHQIAVGFALETNDALENATKKLDKKNFDFIVLNSLQDKGAGFRYDTNKIKVVHKGGILKEFELKSKDDVALDILNEVKEVLKNRPI
ncbi:bifunctional phosphopantothenoylcysteine decarboxylase/phosphopantothenate--cysteine ligase CoaBC [uncultured Arcticibacterium sp.]|uniref:bifunctional phosphopantothenoylcysteine decarboxylase/phosphopantothenate--cysteine ligase CoaBC n=1 Tax=uncultured Arcticibacterium sp. TaxID=2173042 RepID=UPI0030F58D6F